MENKVITAQQLLKKYGLNHPTMINADTAEVLMIEFAKIHVDESHDKIKKYLMNQEIYEQDFDDVYPLNSIK